MTVYEKVKRDAEAYQKEKEQRKKEQDKMQAAINLLSAIRK